MKTVDEFFNDWKTKYGHMLPPMRERAIKTELENLFPEHIKSEEAYEVHRLNDELLCVTDASYSIMRELKRILTSEQCLPDARIQKASQMIDEFFEINKNASNTG